MMRSHKEDLDQRETLIESNRIASEEQLAKKEKGKLQLKAKIEEHEVANARLQSEIGNLKN